MRSQTFKTNRVIPLTHRSRTNTQKTKTAHKIQAEHQHSSQNFFVEYQKQNQENLVYLTIKAMRRKQILQKLVKRIRHLVAPSNVPDNIVQNWEEGLKSQGKDLNQVKEQEQRAYTLDTLQTQLAFRYSAWKYLQIMEGIILIIVFWMCSIQLFFLKKASEQQGRSSLFPLQIRIAFTIFLATKILLKQIVAIALLLDQNKSQQSVDNPSNIEENELEYLINIKKDIIKPVIYFFTYLLFFLTEILFSASNIFLYICLALILIVLAEKMMTNLYLNFESVTTYIESKNLKNEFRLIKLFILSITLCHLIALIMYSMTYIYTDHNWLTSIKSEIQFPYNEQFEGLQWVHNYVYAMYWAITTVVTVGYGDITPVRFYQVVIISFVQLIGTAMFGYMINVIGITVSEINQKNEEFDNYITTINKLSNQYQISRRLCQKFKNQIAHYEQIKQETPLSSKEEGDFLKLMSPNTRNSFILETNIRVIKKSIFFLTFFTVNFQNQIALKLIRRIYKKGEKIQITEQIQNQRKRAHANKIAAESNEIVGSGNKSSQNSLNQQQKNQSYEITKSFQLNQEKQGPIFERYLAIINSGSAKIELQSKNNHMEIKKLLKKITPLDGKPTLNVFGYSSLVMNKNIDLVSTSTQNSVVYLLKRKDILESLDKNMLDFEGFSQLREKMLQFRNLNEFEAPSLRDITMHYIPNIFIVTKKKKKQIQFRSKDYHRRTRRTKLKLITLQSYKNRTLMYIDFESEAEVQSKNFIDVSMNKIFLKHEESDRNYNENIGKKQYRSKAIIDMDAMKIFENFMSKFNFYGVISDYHNYSKNMAEIKIQKRKVIQFKTIHQKWNYSQIVDNQQQQNKSNIQSHSSSESIGKIQQLQIQ